MKKTIVCFGDSNTHGYDAETGGRFDYDKRWPGILANILGNEYYVIEEGLSGRTTVFEDPLHEGLSGLSTIHPILMTHEPISLLIIMLGTNDTKERFHVNAANISLGLERLLKKIYTIPETFLNRIQKILIITPPPIDDRYIHTSVGATMGNGCSKKSRDLDMYYKKVALQYGTYYIDAGAIPNIKMHENDYMHLTSDSHQLLANTIASFFNNIEENKKCL